MGDENVLRAADDFIREEFDDFADTFNEKLEKLEYTTPAKLLDLIGRQEIDTDRFDRALDAGCGTGLCGDGLEKLARSVVGVDLSSKMLQQAAALDVYEELVEDELVTFMQSRPAAFDLVVAADTLVYFGALELVVDGAKTTLRPGGLFAFSVELMAEAVAEGYQFQNSGRFCHAQTYVESCLFNAGFRVSEKEITPIRMEVSSPVIGLLVVAILESGDST
jgi:predicted TPR repeat methyltransferase